MSRSLNALISAVFDSYLSWYCCLLFSSISYKAFNTSSQLFSWGRSETVWSLSISSSRFRMVRCSTVLQLPCSRDIVSDNFVDLHCSSSKICDSFFISLSSFAFFALSSSTWLFNFLTSPTAESSSPIIACTSRFCKKFPLTSEPVINSSRRALSCWSSFKWMLRMSTPHWEVRPTSQAKWRWSTRPQLIALNFGLIEGIFFHCAVPGTGHAETWKTSLTVALR